MWNRAIDKETLGLLIEVRGRRITDGRQEADQVRQGKEDGGQGTERRQAGAGRQGTDHVRQGTEDRGQGSQRRKTGDIGRTR